MAFKIAVIGGTGSGFKGVFEKLSALHAKNSFAFAIIAGNAFSQLDDPPEDYEAQIDSLIKGDFDIPLTTYFALGTSPLHPKVVSKLESSNDELCTNLYFLGKRSTLKTSDGVRIVSLGGVLDPNLAAGTSKDKYTPFHSINDASSLRGVHTADILVTSEWPADIRNHSKLAKPSDDSSDPPTQKSISDLCSALRPRYHFSTSPAFFEREPFQHPKPPPSNDSANDDSLKITRFISLASFGNPAKQKWIYAFTLDTAPSTITTLPAGTTFFPFQTANKKRGLPSQNESYSRFSHQNGMGRPPKKHKPGPDSCFFCLSNPDLATHLVTSIGSESYMTTSKGPLLCPSVLPQTQHPALQQLEIPPHLLIIPLAHAATLGSIPEAESRAASIREMSRYRSALHSLLLKHGKRKLGSVTWEVSRSNGVHTHWQFCAVPEDMCRKGIVEAGFMVEAENQGYPRFEKGKALEEEALEERSDAFRVMVWAPGPEDDTRPTNDGVVEDGAAKEGGSGDEEHAVTAKVSGDYEISLTLPLSASFKFDLQMGRRVVGKLLGVEERANWWQCEQSEEEETQDAEAFKEAFKEFDFTLD
ncbi:MAG: hypothetical protein M1828_004384 [Chrysothrix sp. TS-e1954]|nr:MAG: hypothetical protein M1828_004384 [Chrysothrix sp. TS-e1954]